MTLGVGQTEPGDQSVQESAPARAVTAAMSAETQASPALTVTRGDDVLREIYGTDEYLKRTVGVPWPTPARPQRLRPTVLSRKGNINKGWNAAAQPGPPPGYDVQAAPYRDVLVGGQSYAQAMNYAPAPLTDNLGALRGVDYKEPERELRPGFAQAIRGQCDTTTLVTLSLVGMALRWAMTRPREAR